MREGSAGRLSLVLGGNTAVELPFRFELNPDGFSTGPAKVQISYERTTGNVVITSAGQSLNYSTTGTASAVDVVISSGDQHAITFPALTLFLVNPDTSDQGSRLSKPPTVELGLTPGNSPASGTESATAEAPGATGAPFSTPPASGAAGTAQGSHAQLEIYTPSAIHLGRVEAIRSKSAQRQGNKE